MNSEIEYVAFDADDTLWVNELFFCEYEKEFCSLIKEYLPGSVVSQKLYDMEMSNISLYGYGVKGMMLGMIELIPKIMDAEALPHAISEVIRLGKELLQKPVTLLDGVMRVLTELKEKYKLVLVTKGDLIDQERKIQQSGLTNYFYHVPVDGMLTVISEAEDPKVSVEALVPKPRGVSIAFESSVPVE